MADKIAIIGAGMAGLAAALDLAVAGAEVTVIERARTPGGKMREVEIDGRRLDAGPTVLTMRWVFEDLFQNAGTALCDHLRLQELAVLARHAWGDQCLDLYADIDRSADAIAQFAGCPEARRYRHFCSQAQQAYETFEGPFIRSPRPNVVSLVGRIGWRGLGSLWRSAPMSSLWRALGDHFQDPRLRQLFGRYATYCGSSPFACPATLMMIAHVERAGVYIVEGGMHRLAACLETVARARGAVFRYGVEASAILVCAGRATGLVLSTGERLAADAIIVNADVAALSEGLFGRDVASAASAPSPAQRSLSALTFNLVAQTDGFPLLRHSVFFSNHYRQEFDDIFGRRQLPGAPTVYVCAQDRDDREPAAERAAAAPAERLLILVNAPATADHHPLSEAEIAQCERHTFATLERSGLRVKRCERNTIITTPATFHRLFPATGGALYGQASHGWMASFRRPGSRSRVPGLYLAGGSTHPGPGVPMATLSGRLAAASALSDLVSMRRSPRVATSGGMSMR